MASCALRIHPDANDDTTIEWADSDIERAISTEGYGKGDMEMRWDGARKHLVPLEKVAADAMLKSIPEKAQRVRLRSTINVLIDRYRLFTDKRR